LALFEARREPRRLVYAPSSTAAVGALAFLREQTFPRLIEPPQFIPRTRALAAEPEWVKRLLRYFTPQVIAISTIAAIGLLLASALPTWAALQGGSSPATMSAVLSSVGATGTATTRVEDLSATSFVGHLPFIEQARFFDARAGATPEALRFVQGARQATLLAYVQNVSERVVLPYLHDTVATKGAIEAWTEAVAEIERQAALRSSVAGAYAGPTWQGGSLDAGTRIYGARVTFYACIGNGFCANMAAGMPPFAGAAACSSNLSFGTRFVIATDPARRVFVCLDRGALAPTSVDIWFYDAADGWAWQATVGTRSDIIIVD